MGPASFQVKKGISYQTSMRIVPQQPQQKMYCKYYSFWASTDCYKQLLT